MASNNARAAAAILRTFHRPLSKEFREQMAQVVEALDECISNLSMSEHLHHALGQPYYCKGLDMGRAALALEQTSVGETEK